MTQITPEHQRAETAGRSVAAKLQAFHQGLTPDERSVLDAALRQLGTHPDEATSDTAGYSTVAAAEWAARHVLLLVLRGTAPYQPPAWPSGPS
jgi:hypothetical protein